MSTPSSTDIKSAVLINTAHDRNLPLEAFRRYGVGSTDKGDLLLKGWTILPNGRLKNLGHVQYRRTNFTPEGTPKYRTPFEQKGMLLYPPSGWNPDDIPDHLWVCEGALDAAAWAQHLTKLRPDNGDLTLGIGGTSVMESKACCAAIRNLLLKWGQHTTEPPGLTVVADNDRPGIKAAFRLADRLPDNHKGEPKVIVSVMDGCDVSDMWVHSNWDTIIPARPHPKPPPAKPKKPLLPVEEWPITQAKAAMTCKDVANRLRLGANESGKLRCLSPTSLSCCGNTSSLPVTVSEGQRWECHGCGRSGEQISLIEAVTGKPTDKAMMLLIQWAGLSVHDDRPFSELHQVSK